jgi:hypothetical protein
MFQPDPFDGRTVEELTLWADAQYQKLANIFALLDYDEDTWTPVLSDGTNDATHSVQYGVYTKIGRQVSIIGRVRTTSLGSVSGDLRITGLPFTVSSDTHHYGSICCGWGNGLGITTGTSITGIAETGSTYISLRNWDVATGVSQLQDTEWTADGDLIFSGIYYTG